MKINKIVTYIAETDFGEKTVSAGDHAELVFSDKHYHSGKIKLISEESITISRPDGEYTYQANEIMDIKILGNTGK